MQSSKLLRTFRRPMPISLYAQEEACSSKDMSSSAYNSSSDSVSWQERNRQHQEIVALRTLARSLQTTIKSFQCKHEDGAEPIAADPPRPASRSHRDAHEVLRENADLKRQVKELIREKKQLIQETEKMKWEYKMDAVRARAELIATACQLKDEQRAVERLECAMMSLQARDSAKVATMKTEERRGVNVVNAYRNAGMCVGEKSSAQWKQTEGDVTQLEHALGALHDCLNA